MNIREMLESGASMADIVAEMERRKRSIMPDPMPAPQAQARAAIPQHGAGPPPMPIPQLQMQAPPALPPVTLPQDAIAAALQGKPPMGREMQPRGGPSAGLRESPNVAPILEALRPNTQTKLPPMPPAIGGPAMPTPPPRIGGTPAPDFPGGPATVAPPANGVAGDLPPEARRMRDLAELNQLQDIADQIFENEGYSPRLAQIQAEISAIYSRWGNNPRGPGLTVNPVGGM